MPPAVGRKGETQVKIHEEQWDAFFDAIQNHVSSNVKESQFILSYLQPDGFNKLWIQTFRNLLSQSADQRKVVLSAAVEKAKEEFNTAVKPDVANKSVSIF